jgi:hypothetical protein
VAPDTRADSHCLKATVLKVISGADSNLFFPGCSLAAGTCFLANLPAFTIGGNDREGPNVGVGVEVLDGLI